MVTLPEIRLIERRKIYHSSLYCLLQGGESLPLSHSALNGRLTKAKLLAEPEAKVAKNSQIVVRQNDHNLMNT